MEKPKKQRPKSEFYFMFPFVSIIIPCYKEEKNLISTIDHLTKNTDYPKYEIIAVVSEPNENLIGQITRKKVKIIRTKKRSGISLARNLGAKKAKGKILIFADCHIFPKSSNWLVQIVSFIENNPNSIVGPNLTQVPKTLVKKYQMTNISKDSNPRIDLVPKNIGLFMKPEYGMIKNQKKTFAIAAGFHCIKKEKFWGFDEKFKEWGYEDIDFCITALRLGMDIHILPVKIAHLFKEEQVYQVQQLNVQRNATRMAFKHLNKKDIMGFLWYRRQYRGFLKAISLTIFSDVWSERKRLNQESKYTFREVLKKLDISI